MKPFLRRILLHLPSRLSRLALALALGFAAALLTLPAARAELLVHESFDYLAGTALDGASGGLGFAGPWSDTSDPGTYTVEDAVAGGWQGVPDGGYPNTGGFAAGHFQDDNEARRPLAPSVTATFTDGSVTWMSMVSGLPDITNNTHHKPNLAIGQGALLDNRAQLADGQAIGGGGRAVGNGPGLLQACYWDDENGSPASFEEHRSAGELAQISTPAQPHQQLIVYKITWGPSSDTVQLANFDISTSPYVPPTETAFNAVAVAITSGGNLDQSSFDTLSVHGTRASIDEIRVATTFAEAIGPHIPNPSFEADTFTVWPGYTSANGGTITGWTQTGAVGLNPVDGHASPNPFADNGTVPNGSNVAFLQSIATLSTTIRGLVPGTHYRLTFRSNRRSIEAAPLPTFSVNGIDQGAFPNDIPVGGISPYRTTMRTFLATAPSADLVVRNDAATDATLLIDHFQINVDHSVFTTSESGGELTITGYDLGGQTCPTGELVIPASIGGKQVTSIGEFAFRDCSGLTAVTLPAGLTSIGFGAFAGCSGLTAVTLPAGLTSIGVAAFSRCSGLTALTLPAGLTSIGDFAFFGCTSLTAVTLPDSLASIGDFAFRDCSGLTAVHFLGDAPSLEGFDVFLGVAFDATVYYVPGTNGWQFFGGLPTALWDPAARVTSIMLADTTIDLVWRDFRPGASYRIENSSDGRTWTTVAGFGDVTGTSATIPRPAGVAQLFVRVVGNGG